MRTWALARASIAIVATAVISPGCYSVRPSSGGGKVPETARPAATRQGDVLLPDGYVIEKVASGLTYPTGITFDERGQVYVVESGYSYGESVTTPRLLRLEPNGGFTVIASGNNPPWNGVAHHRGSFYVAEGGVREGGKILRVGLDGSITALVEGLPSLGDHHTDGPAVGPDGYVYFGQGTATNSGVVGEDSAEFGWLKRHPEFHDTPCKDIKLTGANFISKNPFKEGEMARTGPFSAFGTPSVAGQVIAGKVPCNGAVMRVPVGGGPVELVAWGLRNPYGLAFAPDGQLYVTENGYDIRGSRPVYGAGDYLWRIKPGAFYGWPDFAGGEPVASMRFKPPGKDMNPPLIADPPPVEKPVTQFGVHSSSNGLDFSRNAAFGYAGDAFVAQFGDMTPETGKVFGPVGFKVVRVDVKRGVVEDFATNRGPGNGPASKLKTGGLERPIAVRFDPQGTAMWIVDFGVMVLGEQGPSPKPKTGSLWRVTRVSR